MVKIMDIPDPRGRGSFWEAYRGARRRTGYGRIIPHSMWAGRKTLLISCLKNLSPTNDMVNSPRGIQPWSPCDGRRLSKKGWIRQDIWMVEM